MSDRSYRLYYLCEQGGIRGAISREFPDDGAARDHAVAELSHYPSIEVWQTDRLVGLVCADDRLLSSAP